LPEDLFWKWWEANDQQAFGELVRLTYPQMLRIAKGCLPGMADQAEDVIQEALADLFIKHQTGAKIGCGIAYLYQMLRNKCRTRIRKTKRAGPHEVAMVEEPVDRSHDVVTPDLKVETVIGALASLVLDKKVSPSIRVVLGIWLACAVKGVDRELTTKELRGLTRCGAQAVGQRKFKAHNLLKKLVKDMRQGIQETTP
jgi:hypothetical protein